MSGRWCMCYGSGLSIIYLATCKVVVYVFVVCVGVEDYIILCSTSNIENWGSGGIYWD